VLWPKLGDGKSTLPVKKPGPLVPRDSVFGFLFQPGVSQEQTLALLLYAVRGDRKSVILV